MAPLRVGLLGTGYWALHVHGTALTASPDASLEGVWGRDPAKAHDLAARLRTKGYDDLDELLGSVDAVSIALPPGYPSEPCCPCGQGRLSPPDGQTARPGCRLGASRGGCCRRSWSRSDHLFHSSFSSRHGGLDKGISRGRSLGQRPCGPLRQHLRPGSPYATSAWRKQYGALWDVGPHALAAVLPIMGKVTSVAARRGPKGSDTVQVVLNHEPLSATSTLSMSLTMPAAATTSQLVLYGEHGTRARPEGNFDAVGTFGIAISELVSLVESGERAHRCDAHFGLEVVRVLAAAGRALDLPAMEIPHE